MWDDVTDTGVISVGARPDDGITFGHAVFGTSDGKLLRTIDACLNIAEVHSVSSVRFEAVVWDWREPSRVWALDDDMVLYLSSDGGATFAVYDDIGSILGHGSSIGKSIGLPGSGGVFVYGGTGANAPLMAFINQVGFHNWTEVTFAGQLASDISGGSPPADIAIVDSVDKGDGSGAVIVFENAEAGDSGVRPVYHRASTEPVQGGDWTRGTGFASGDVDAAFVVGAPGRGAAGTINFIMAFHDRDAWRSNDGIVWTEVTNVLPANHIFNHALWGFAQTHNMFLASFYIAAVEDTVGQTGGIYKSTDEFATALGLLRPATGFDTWPSSAIGRQVSIGRSQATEGRFLVHRLDTPNRGVAWRSSSVAWSSFDTVNFSGSNDILAVYAFTDQLWFMLGWFHAADPDSGQAIRTEDGGATWDDVFATPTDGGLTRHWRDFARTSDGRLWGMTSDDADDDHVEIWFSDDDGDNWTEAHDFLGGNDRFSFLVAHPTNRKRVAAFGEANSGRNMRTVFSVDAQKGASSTWNSNTDASIFPISGAPQFDRAIIQLTSNRFIFIADGAVQTTTEAWYTSDDNGANWIRRNELTGLDGILARLCSIVGEKDGSRLYTCLRNQSVSPVTSSIYVSTDGGVTWTDIENDVPVLHIAHMVRNGIFMIKP